MKKISGHYFKRLLSALALFVFSLIMIKSTYINISDKPIPLGPEIMEASFYIQSNTDALVCIGNGSVLNGIFDINTPEDIETCIVQEPDCTNYISQDQTIIWKDTVSVLNKVRVIGEISNNSLDTVIDVPQNNVPENDFEDLNSQTLILSREEIINASKNDYPPNVDLKWDNFGFWGADFNDGIIPQSLIDDAVYCSMNLPSEALSDYMISINRDNAHIISPMTPLQTTAVPIGALYKVSGETLPDNFTICLGKIALYAYSKSNQEWICVDSNPYPNGLMIYTLPWTSSKQIKIANIKYCDDHVEVPMTSELFSNNVFHFWGVRTPIDQDDYIYYSVAYSFWVKEESADGKLIATSGIDAKDASGSNAIQLVSSRALSVRNYSKIQWAHTIPNSEYNFERDGSVLSQLYVNQ